MPQFEELMEALDDKYFEADVTAAIEVRYFFSVEQYMFNKAVEGLGTN